MSTKESIWNHSEVVEQRQYTHVYSDCFDEGPLKPIYIEHGPLHVTLPIPALRAIYDQISAQIAHARTRADETDEAIEARVRSYEADTTRNYAEWVKAGKPKGTAGAIRSFGGETPESERVAKGIADAKAFREECQAALRQWEELL